MSFIDYKGKDRDGMARTGRTEGSPAFLIQKLFAQGWLWAIAVRDGVEVGGIGFDVENEQDRTWWAES